MQSCVLQERQRKIVHTHTHTHRGEGDVKAEQTGLKMLAWETGGKWPYTEKYWRPPKPGGNKEAFLPWGVQRSTVLWGA